MYVVHSRQLLTVGLLLFAQVGCSILSDLSTRQCERNTDCGAFGTNYRCDLGLCVSVSGHGGTAGAASSDAAGAPFYAAVGGGGGVGGAPAPITCRSSAECTAVYGTADPRLCIQGLCQPSTAECATHADCFTKRGEVEPLACVQGKCVALLSEQCPIVLPRLTGDTDIYGVLKRSNAVVTGAFAYISPSSLDGIAVRNIDLALRDFASKANGIVLSGERRDVVTVVCFSNQLDDASILAAGKHLAYDLDVPAILAALPADDVQRLFETFRSERGKNVFLLMPNYTDETLISLEDDWLIWHMLSDANSLSASYPPLLELTEVHLRNSGVLTATDSLRVALITATDERFLADLGAAIRGRIRFNGDQSAAQNAPTNFTEEGTISYTTDESYDQVPMVNRLLNFAPHIIIGATGDEILEKIIPLVEQKWSSTVGSQSRPFYLLSPFNYNSSRLAALQSHPTVRLRMAGINWPSAVDHTLYDSYIDHYALTFGTIEESYENYYDATYYFVYAMAGGRSASATSVAAGFRRLLAGTKYQVGQVDMIPLLNSLGAPRGEVSLVGTMGPPNWDANTGARLDAGSVWCVDANGVQHSDVLRPPTPPVTGNVESLTGKFDCFEFPKVLP